MAERLPVCVWCNRVHLHAVQLSCVEAIQSSAVLFADTARTKISMQQVDIDLATEGDARKVSRRAVSIMLHGDGAFRLRCLGRRSVSASLSHS